MNEFYGNMWHAVCVVIPCLTARKNTCPTSGWVLNGIYTMFHLSLYNSSRKAKPFLNIYCACSKNYLKKKKKKK